jgi:iron complex outermembrane receptor protein
MVLVAAKTPMRLEEAASVVSVITRDEIQRAGYRSVADAIRGVAGLYLVDDHLKGNLGVRGVTGGLRAWSSVVKVLVNGQPTAFRPDTSNYLGVELIPIEAVEQIEVVRGPASALYGANAFLGVINILTRSGEDVDGLEGKLRGSDAVGTGVGGGFSIVAGHRGKRTEWLLATAGEHVDRSGLPLPQTSPSGPSDLGSDESKDDLAQPLSVFAHVRLELSPAVRFSVDGLLSRLDQVAEWQDWKPLQHGSRVVEENGYVRGALEVAAGDLSLRLATAFVFGRPGDGDRIDRGSTSYYRRRVSYAGVDGNLEGRYQLSAKSSIIAGVDLQLEEQELQTYDEIVKSSGETHVIGTPTTDLFQNMAGYAQAILYPRRELGLTIGVRVDRHDVYGTQPALRLAVVYLPQPTVAFKLLYGGSFKAPSAVHLFTATTTLGDIEGNPDLEPQTAHVLEGALVYRPMARLRVEAAAYAMRIADQVVFEEVDRVFRATNTARVTSLGVELEVRLGLTPSIAVFGNTSVVDSQVENETNPFSLQSDDPELYPRLQGRAGVESEWLGQDLGVTLRAESGWIGPRGASQTHAIQTPAYSIPGYPLLAIALSTRDWRPFLGRETTVAVRGDNLLNWTYSEPGYGGADIPQPGARLWASVAVAL